MDFKEKEMNLELKEQDSEHNKKKKEEGSPKRKKGCFKRVLSVLVLVVIIGFSFLAGRQSVMTSNAYGTGLNNGKILRKLSMLEAFAGNYYLNKIDAENVENNIYKGFAKGLQDPYAEYYTPSEYQQLSFLLQKTQIRIIQRSFLYLKISRHIKQGLRMEISLRQLIKKVLPIWNCRMLFLPLEAKIMIKSF